MNSKVVMLLHDYIGYDRETGKGIDGAYFAAEMLYLASCGVKEIEISINSLGGSVKEGYSIVGAIRQINNDGVCSVNTSNDGIAYSMAGIIASCGKKAKMQDYALFGMHDPAMAAPSVVEPEEEEVEDAANENSILMLMKKSLVTILSARTEGKTTEAEIDRLMTEDTMLDASECLSLGLCTEIVSSVKKPAISKMQNAKEAFAIVNSFINHKTESKMSLLNIANAFGLPKEANESEVIAKIADVNNALASEKTAKLEIENKLKAANEVINSYKAKEAEIQNATIGEFVTGLVNEGRIANTPEAIAFWTKNAKEDFGATKIQAASLKLNKEAPKAPAIETASNDGRANWTFEEWSKKDSKGLQEMQNSNPAKFNKLLETLNVK